MVDLSLVTMQTSLTPHKNNLQIKSVYLAHVILALYYHVQSIKFWGAQ